MDTDYDSSHLGQVNFYSKKRGQCLPTAEEKPDLHSSASVDPDIARQLFEEGAFLFFLDVPEKTEFGIDTTSWNVGEKFKGLKMIPPGIHFVYYSAVSKDDVTSPRTGFFHNFKSREVLVKRWDHAHEGMSVEVVSAEETERLSLNVKNLDGYLGAYPYTSYKKWVSLTRWITDDTVERLSPLGPNRSVFSVQQLESLPHISSRAGTEAPPKKLKAEARQNPLTDLPDMKVIESTRIRFSDLSLRPVTTAGAVPSDITRLNMDRSGALEKLISTDCTGVESEALAEIQFAFVCFLTGQVYDAFEQWKKLVALLCSCEESIHKRPQLFIDFIGLMFFQLREVPRDFFVDIVSQENFLTQTLQGFFSIVENSPDVDEALRSKAQKFKQHLQKQFSWDFSTEVGEDAPTIVED
ncbi:Protein AAR2-like protein [Hypsibius exemplaris]|uniref:Protein AAR2 homolog n=1 Tax=Hypsibius exemplaris TaxID=2072580 RepID=A0A1W0XAR8_HYPEX|nr:Protein AAR2-like protein [Hypsibius exemplaris]